MGMRLFRICSVSQAACKDVSGLKTKRIRKQTHFSHPPLYEPSPRLSFALRQGSLPLQNTRVVSDWTQEEEEEEKHM